MRMRISFFPNIRSQTLLMLSPMFATVSCEVVREINNNDGGGGGGGLVGG